ncbi:MAG: hypothetical protein J6Q82_01985 [Clostridia bacterium]|nr:hypothetical protein [Clostridia bacterium]
MTFTRESFLKELRIAEMPELYGKDFDAVMKEYDEQGVWFLTDEFLDQIQTDFAMFTDKYEFVKTSIAKVRENELLARHSLLLYHMLKDRAPGEIANVTEEAVPPSEEERAAYEMSAFFAELAFAPAMKEFLHSREVPEDIYLLTIRDVFNGSLHNYNNLFGRDGFEATRIFRWNQRLIDCTILHIGLLNFEMRKKFIEAAVVLRNKAGEAAILVHDQPVSASGIIAGSAGAEEEAFFGAFTETDEYYEGYPIDSWNAIISPEKKRYPKSEWELYIGENDPVISVHIPKSKDFTPENMEKAYADCLNVLEKSFPEYKPKAFYCHSWLMEPQLRDMMKPTSNILAFQGKYLRFPRISDGRAVLIFLFSDPTITNWEDLPENSSLQRAVKQHYLNGKFIYEPCGFFFFDAVKR